MYSPRHLFHIYKDDLVNLWSASFFNTSICFTFLYWLVFYTLLIRSLHNSVDDDLSALQPFQQLGTISIFVLAPLLSCHFVWTVWMNFVNLSFSFNDKFSLQARIKALSRLMLPNECLRDSTNKTKPNSGKNISYTHTKATLNVYNNNINGNWSFPFSLAPLFT